RACRSCALPVASAASPTQPTQVIYRYVCKTEHMPTAMGRERRRLNIDGLAAPVWKAETFAKASWNGRAIGTERSGATMYFCDSDRGCESRSGQGTCARLLFLGTPCS